jgi:CrcB protein
MLRYLVGRALNAGIPWGTLIVNVLGCLVIGLLSGLFERVGGSGHAINTPEVRLLLTVGFCGGFTTFSAFMSEGLAMLRAGDMLLFGLYCAGSVLLGLAAVWIGRVIVVSY